jgi:Putative transposase
MTLASNEFIRRFLIHVLPHSFHRIRHYGLFASAGRAENIARARQLLHGPKPQSNPTNANTIDELLSHRCPCCGGRMITIETFKRGSAPHYRPTAPTVDIRIDTSRAGACPTAVLQLRHVSGASPIAACKRHRNRPLSHIILMDRAAQHHRRLSATPPAAAKSP